MLTVGRRKRGKAKGEEGGRGGRGGREGRSTSPFFRMSCSLPCAAPKHWTQALDIV